MSYTWRELISSSRIDRHSNFDFKKIGKLSIDELAICNLKSEKQYHKSVWLIYIEKHDGDARLLYNKQQTTEKNQFKTFLWLKISSLCTFFVIKHNLMLFDFSFIIFSWKKVNRSLPFFLGKFNANKIFFSSFNNVDVKWYETYEHGKDFFSLFKNYNDGTTFLIINSQLNL